MSLLSLKWAAFALLKGKTVPLTKLCPEGRQDLSEKLEPEKWFICGICSGKVVPVAEAIEIEGSQQHQKINPDGISFIVGCFSHAPGCQAVGEDTGYYSWFSGYSWCVLICRQCGLHLGWRFKRDTDLFFGLIMTRLMQK